MKKSLRIAGLLVLAAIAAGGGYFLFRGGEGAGPPAALAFPQPDSSRGCRECHPEIYAQWESSYHQKAWDDPEVNGPGLDLRANPDCWSCHIPEPVFVSGLGLLPRSRSVRRSEGIDCIACHYAPRGMAGKTTNAEPPCKPVAEARIADIALCYGCHNQHKTHDEWKTSKFHPKTDCNECHMPWREGVATRGKPAKRYRSHAWLGSHDNAFIGSAVRLEGRVENGEAIVTLANDFAGHNFPTDSRFHMAQIRGDLLTSDGDLIRDLFQETFRNPARNAVNTFNTQIKPGETKTYRVRIEPIDGILRLRLIFCLQPNWIDIGDRLGGNKAVVVKELRVPLKK